MELKLHLKKKNHIDERRDGVVLIFLRPIFRANRTKKQKGGVDGEQVQDFAEFSCTGVRETVDKFIDTDLVRSHVSTKDQSLFGQRLSVLFFSSLTIDGWESYLSLFLKLHYRYKLDSFILPS